MWWILASVAMGAVPSTVADAVKSADCASVIAALPNPAADDERLAVGYCQQHDHHDADALTTLGDVKSGVYGEYARVVRARALIALGRDQEAADALTGLTLPGSTGISVRLLRDEALLTAGKGDLAKGDLTALVADSSVSDEARYELAIAAEKTGDAPNALAGYRKTWASSVRGPWSKQAADALTRLGHPVPDLATSDGRALVSDRIAALRRHNQNSDALALSQSLRAVSPATTSSQRLDDARLSFDGHDYKAAVTLYKAALGAAATCDGATSDLFNYALATARTGDYDTAAVIYRRLGTLHPDAKEADFASFKLGYMLYDQGKCPEARKDFARHVKERPDSTHLDEALWFSSRCAWKSGDVDAAVSTLADLVAKRPNSPLVPGAAYWQARAKGVKGDPAAEKEALEHVIAAYPVSGSAWFAAQRLGRTFPKHEAVARPAWPAALATDSAVKRGEALLAVGLQGWARVELEREKGTAEAAGKEGALAAAYALIAAGDYQGGAALAKPYCAASWKSGDAVALQACTPRPEAGIVAAMAAKYGLDPLLPYGIMTAESGLDPSVTSLAGARGLMQLMPIEAGTIHQKLYGERPYDADDLYSAPYNAGIGTAELGLKAASLGAILKGSSEPAVIAAYNGGEEAVRRWVQGSAEAPEPDAFAEDVGYVETRQYVRRVLGFVMAYRWVYGD